MAKPRSRILDYAVYFAIRTAWCILTAVPLSWSMAIVRTLALVGYYADRRHRLVAIDNLRCAFPGVYTDEQLCRITRNVFRHFALVLLEIMLIRRKSRSRRWRELMMKDAAGLVDQVLATGRPLLIATAHYGNWELAAFILSLYGIRAHLVARRMDNPYLDDLMRRYRESFGHTVLSKRGDLGRDALHAGRSGRRFARAVRRFLRPARFDAHGDCLPGTKNPCLDRGRGRPERRRPAQLPAADDGYHRPGRLRRASGRRVRHHAARHGGSGTSGSL